MQRWHRPTVALHDPPPPPTPTHPFQVLEDEQAARYVHGIGIHWYLDFIGPIQDTVVPTHELYPDVFILATEASVGSHFWERDVILGCWERGNQYSHSILTVRPRGGRPHPTPIPPQSHPPKARPVTFGPLRCRT